MLFFYDFSMLFRHCILPKFLWFIYGEYFTQFSTVKFYPIGYHFTAAIFHQILYCFSAPIVLPNLPLFFYCDFYLSYYSFSTVNFYLIHWRFSTANFYTFCYRFTTVNGRNNNNNKSIIYTRIYLLYIKHDYKTIYFTIILWTKRHHAVCNC